MRYTLFLYLFCGFSAVFAAQETAPVSGFAREFILGTAITGATITILETGQTITTDDDGKFGPINYPVNKPITLLLEKWGYKTTQTGTLNVPNGGLTDPSNNITFQVPSIATYYLLKAIIGGTLDDDKCHVVTTVLAHGKNMDDDEQGEPDAKIVLSPSIDQTPFYFGIFEAGPLKGKTDPFTKGLTATTKDGGVGFYNLPPSEQAYSITASKDGVTFSTAQFLCRKGAFINISPPSGPMAQL